ncbi:hypothetical protein PsorP6_011950 [Peronosclerospora sorghi]|uniref:Uncharacterized protein n=1 Tax=Peronosclerospora sorghi TaxID=230839 RepID=A0ACC0WKV6_9STRA|nr:hypothetical protein PsorP6_011950 [Peronosclerospora sorghi]
MQEQVERLNLEKTQKMEESGSLETQLEKTRALLADKSDELKEATEILKRCKEDRAVSRAKVDAQASEHNEFTQHKQTADWTNKEGISMFDDNKRENQIVEQTVLKELKSKIENKKNKEKKIEELKVTTSDSKRVELVD